MSHLRRQEVTDRRFQSVGSVAQLNQGIIWRAPPFESVKTESPPATQEARF